MSSTAPLRVALIGCGDISRAHLDSYKNLGYEVIALCDIDRARAEARKTQFKLDQVRVFDNHHELLALPEIDLVTIATPVAQHAPLVTAALEAGKHVACEKPSALTIEENQAIIAVAEKHQRHVIFFSSRFRNGATHLARQYIEDGELGEIYRVNVRYYRSRGRPGVDMLREAAWFTNKSRAGGGVLMDMGQYFMDQVFHLTHWPKIQTVSGWAFQGFPYELPEGQIYDVEEHCTFMARTDGPLFNFDFANISHQKQGHYISILGTKGGIVLDVDNYFTFYNEKCGPWRQMEHKSEWRDKTNGNDYCYKQLADAIRGGPSVIGTTPAQALEISLGCTMAYQSHLLGREVRREEFVK